MVKKNNTVLIIIAIVLAIFIFRQGEVFKGGVVDNSCELDRSCCEDTELDFVCYKNDYNPSISSPFEWKDLHLDEQHIEEFYLHYPGSMFILSNKGSFQNFAKGGIGRQQYGNYFTLNGPRLGFGGFNKARWTPTKLMGSGGATNGPNFGGKYEFEITSDRYYTIMNGRFKCEDSLCITPFSWSFSNVDSISTPIYRTDIDGQYCGFQQNIKDTPSNIEWEPPIDRDFLFIFDPCPASNNPLTNTVDYNLVQGEVKDIKIIITTIDHEEGVSDWINNYYDKELMIRQEYENFMQAFKSPDTTNIIDKKNYYIQLYTHWFNLYGVYDDSIANNYGSRLINIPSYQFLGLWKSDTILNSLMMLSAVNPASSDKGIVLEYVKGWLTIWKENSQPYPTIFEMPGMIFKEDVEPTQGYYFMPLVAWNLYQIDNDKQFMCDLVPYFRSDYEFYKQNRVKDEWLLAGADGDGTDKSTFYSGSDFSADFALGALTLANMYHECGDSVTSQQMYSDFNNIKSKFNEILWEESEKIYCNRNSAGDCNYHNNDGVSYAAGPHGNCLAISLGIADDIKTSKIMNTLKTDFVQNEYGFTSIPTQHFCFDFGGLGKSGCNGGGTWDGPIWGWENMQCQWAMKQKVEVDGETKYQSDLDYINDMFLKIARSTPFATESYNDQGPALWGAAPYGYGTVFGILPLVDFNPFETLQFVSITSNCASLRTALGTAITNWISGTKTRAQLGQSIQDWVNC